MIDILILIPLISALCSLFIFSYVFGQRKNDAANRTFLPYSLCIFLTCMLDFLVHLPFTSAILGVLTKTGMIFFLLTAPANLDFIYAVTGTKRDRLFYAILCLTFFSMAISIFSHHHAIIADLKNGIPFAIPTLHTIPFFLSTYLPSVYALYLLYRARGSVQPENRRHQVNLIFWAMIIALSFLCIVLIAVPLAFRTFAAFRFVGIGAIIYVAFIYRAIRKYGFLSVDTREVEAVSNLLFKNFNDAVIITDPAGAIIQINGKARQMFGDAVSDGTIGGLSKRLADSRFDQGCAQFAMDLREGERIRHLAVSQTAVMSDTGTIGKFIAIRDITEDKKNEEETAAVNRMESLGLLAGGVAHDFNNQLTGILSAAELLKLEIPENHVHHELADMIVTAARRSSDLTTQLLAFARRGKFQSVRVNIHAIVKEVASILERSIDKRITIRQELHAAEILVRGDPSQLYHALLNIALNSRDAMPNGGEIVFKTAVIDVDKGFYRRRPVALTPGKYIELLVSDTGTGMDDQVRKRIFEPFFTTKENGKGTGMGLAAAYGAIRNHNGLVDVESAPGSGTTMKILLPLADGSDAFPAEGSPRNAPCQKSRILIVDDENIVASTLKKILAREGHAVSVCSNGNEAIERYRASWNTTDIVLLDIVMPGLNGYETFIALRRINPRVRVLMMSGFSKDEEVQNVINAGADGFIRKPFNRDDLLLKIAAVVTGKEVRTSA